MFTWRRADAAIATSRVSLFSHTTIALFQWIIVLVIYTICHSTSMVHGHTMSCSCLVQVRFWIISVISCLSAYWVFLCIRTSQRRALTLYINLGLPYASAGYSSRVFSLQRIQAFSLSILSYCCLSIFVAIYIAIAVAQINVLFRFDSLHRF